MNVVVGPNDSGKSNIFRAIKLLVDTLSVDSSLNATDLFSLHSDPRLEARIRLSQAEAEILLDFFSVHALKLQGSNTNQTFVYAFKDRKRVADSLKNLRLEAVWQPTNNASFSPTCTFYFDDLCFKVYSQTSQAIAIVAPEFPLPEGSVQHDGFPQFIESLSAELPETANASQLLDSKGWYFAVPPIPVNNLANPTVDRTILDRLFSFAGLSFGSGYTLSFSRMMAAIFRRAFFISTGGTIFLRKALQLEQSININNTVAQEIMNSTQFSGTLEPDGWNLAEFLFSLKNSYVAEERERFGLIQEKFEKLTTNLTFDVIQRSIFKRNIPQGVPDAPNFNSRYPHIVVKDARNSKQFLLEQVGAGITESLFLLTIFIGLKDALVLLDEPAVNLHPAQMKALFRGVELSSNQLVAITHSPALLHYLLFERDASIVHVRRQFQESLATVLDTKKAWSSSERYGLSYQIDARVFFARHVLVGEGETDRNFLEAVSDAYRMEPDTYEDIVVDAGGKFGLPKYHKLLSIFGVPYTIVADGDNQPEPELKARAMSYSGEERFQLIDEGFSDDARGCTVFFFKDKVERFMENQDPALYSSVGDSVRGRGGRVGKPIFMHEFVPALMSKDPLALTRTVKPILESAFDVQNREP